MFISFKSGFAFAYSQTDQSSPLIRSRKKYSIFFSKEYIFITQIHFLTKKVLKITTFSYKFSLKFRKKTATSKEKMIFRKFFWFLASLSRGLSNPLRGFSSASILLKQKGERGMGQPDHSPFSQYERGIRQDVHFVSRLALRVTARGRNLKLACVRFALGEFVEPSARVLIHPLFHLKQKAKPYGFAFRFKGERGIRTLGPVTDSGFRDRPIRPLWHLSEVCII